jgi:hypothetical protein
LSDRNVNFPKTGRRLAPSEKYEVFVPVLTGQATHTVPNRVICIPPRA